MLECINCKSTCVLRDKLGNDSILSTCQNCGCQTKLTMTILKQGSKLDNCTLKKYTCNDCENKCKLGSDTVDN